MRSVSQTQTDGEGRSGKRARKSDQALLRTGGVASEGQPEPLASPQSVPPPRDGSSAPLPAGDPARIARAIGLVAAPDQQILTVSQISPGCRDRDPSSTRSRRRIAWRHQCRREFDARR